MVVFIRPPELPRGAEFPHWQKQRREINNFANGKGCCRLAPGTILTNMALTSKNPRTSRYRLAQTDIPDFANKNREEQIALFSKRVMENSQRPIYRLWSKLDPFVRSVILSELGCFDGEVRGGRDKRAREVAAELKRHMHSLGTFLKKQAEHEYRTHRPPRFHQPHVYLDPWEGRCTLRRVLEIEIEHLRHSRATILGRLKRRGKWDVSGIIRAQEFLNRRAAFLGIRGSIRLTPGAIADIYQLSQRTPAAGDDSGTPETIRKAIDNFKKDHRNAHFLENIEYYLKDWTKPSDPVGKSGN